MNVCLSVMAPSDQEFLRKLRSNPDVADWLFAPTRDITAEEQGVWYRKVMRDPYHLVWIARTDHIDPYRIPALWGEQVGYGQLYDIDMLHMTAEIGVAVAPFYHRQGCGGAITERLLHYAFEMIGLHSVTARVFCHNPNALMMFGHCGFSVRGWLPDAIYKQGRFRDVFLMSRLNNVEAD